MHACKWSLLWLVEGASIFANGKCFYHLYSVYSLTSGHEILPLGPQPHQFLKFHSLLDPEPEEWIKEVSVVILKTFYIWET